VRYVGVCTNVCQKNVKRRSNLDNILVNGKVIFHWVLNRMGVVLIGIILFKVWDQWHWLMKGIIN